MTFWVEAFVKLTFRKGFSLPDFQDPSYFACLNSPALSPAGCALGQGGGAGGGAGGEYGGDTQRQLLEEGALGGGHGCRSAAKHAGKSLEEREEPEAGPEVAKCEFWEGSVWGGGI